MNIRNAISISSNIHLSHQWNPTRLSPTSVSAHTHACAHTHTRTHTYIHMHTHTHIHTHMHTYTHIHTPTHTHTHTHTYVTAYVILSGLSALIMHSLWREVLFFHSPGNFSFSGHSLSTNFFHLLAEPSMSLSKFLNASKLESDLMPPQHWCERKSTGLVTLGVAGNRRRKSSSVGSICLPILRTYLYFSNGREIITS